MTYLLPLLLWLLATEPSEPTLEQLTRENAQLTESLRVAEHRSALLAAQLEDTRTWPGPSEHVRWHGHKSATRIGAFDMLEVARWEGKAGRRPSDPWRYYIYFRATTTPPLELDATEFNEFAKKFDSYLKRP